MPEPIRGPWWRNTASLVTASALVLIFAVIARRVGDPDFWWHLRTGQWIVQNHALPAHDLFTYTVSNHPWLDHEYLSEILIFTLFTWGGFAVVSMVFALITWAGFYAVWRRMEMENSPAVIVFLGIGLAALAGAAVWGPRTQMITFAFTCLELYWIELFLRRRSRTIWYLPVAVVVWANFHGGFVFSLLLLAVALVCQLLLWGFQREIAYKSASKTLALVLLCCAVAGLLTPHGFDLYTYTLKTQFSHVQQNFIAEWKSPNFHEFDMRAFEAMLLLLLIGFAVRRPRLWDVLLVLTATVLALQSVRHIALFVAAVTPVLVWSYAPVWEHVAGRITHPWLTVERLRQSALVLLALCIFGTGIFVASTFRGQTASTDANFPVGAADWLESHPGTGNHVFNAYDWGGYLIYRFYPEDNRRVFSFGEAELLGDQLLQKVSDIENAKPDWQTIMNDYSVDYVVERPDSPLVMALSVDPGWTKAYDDGFSVIYVRQ